MINIQKINDTLIDIVSESEKLFDNKYDLGQINKFKEKILVKFFIEEYDYYFSARMFQKYEQLTIAETKEKVLSEIKLKYGTLENNTAFWLEFYDSFFYY